MSSDDLKPMPLVNSVQVLRYDAQGQPWPVATIHIDAAGKIAFIGDASKAYAPLLNAARKAGIRLAQQSINQAMQETRSLRDDLGPPAQEPNPVPPSAGDGF